MFICESLLNCTSCEQLTERNSGYGGFTIFKLANSSRSLVRHRHIIKA